MAKDTFHNTSSRNNTKRENGNCSTDSRQFSKKNNRQNEYTKKKVGLNARNDKAKYSDDEIAKAKYLDSKAKFIVRDRIHDNNINTKNKWIGITNLKYEDRWDSKGNYNPEILSFDTEIYDRTVQPVYDEYMTDEQKHQLTYDVAESDIAKQQKQEARKHVKSNRPSYHVEVATKYTKNKKTEYQVKNIEKKR